MSGVKAFLDTNILIYLYSDSDSAKKEQVIQAINQYERFVSTQVINEFCNVCIRKLKLPIASVLDAVHEITSACNILIVDDGIARAALVYCDKYRYSFYDSLILASALDGGCRYLLSEDMADGQIIENRLIIKSIFSVKSSA